MELIENENFHEHLLEKVDEILKSGFVDPESEETGTYGLAKVILYCALKFEAEAYRPISDSYRKKYRGIIKYYT